MIEMDEQMLKKLKFTIIQKLDKEFNIEDVSEYLDHQCDILYIKIGAFVYAEQDSVQHKEFITPVNLWEHFKQDCFPKWLKKYFPVRYEKTVFDVHAIYPTLKTIIPGHERKLIITKYNYEWVNRPDWCKSN